MHTQRQIDHLQARRASEWLEILNQGHAEDMAAFHEWCRKSPLHIQEFLEISVTDSGMGMTPEAMESLFKPFSQIDSGLSRKFEGTGLGLALVKLLADLHGGAVAVESAVGEGSCFTVWLPMRAPGEPARAMALAIDKSFVRRLILNAIRNGRAPTATAPAVSCIFGSPTSGARSGLVLISSRNHSKPLLRTFSSRMRSGRSAARS